MQDFNINQTIYDGRPIKVFLSYSSDDRHQAGVIKAVLENYGFDVFLAHHDIEPSKHWLAEIIHEIKECSIFIPFLTPNSLNSYYVNQEIGMACVDSKKLIFPLKIYQNPWGFIAGYQAMKLDIETDKSFIDSVNHACQKLVNQFKKDKPEELKASLIYHLRFSKNYAQSNKIGKILDEYDDFTSEQLNELFRIYFTNDQVRGSYESTDLILKLLANNSSIIIPPLKELGSKLLKEPAPPVTR